MGKDINHDVSAERQITDVTSAERQPQHLACNVLVNVNQKRL